MNRRVLSILGVLLAWCLLFLPAFAQFAGWKPGWRLLSGIEALSGILLAGWTTALFFTVLQQVMPVSKQGREAR